MAFGVFLVVAILFWPVFTQLLNSVTYPGYETCKREIARSLRNPDNAKYEYPPRRSLNDPNPDIWTYAIEVRSQNAMGGTSSTMIGCIVDTTGQETKYKIYW